MMQTYGDMTDIEASLRHKKEAQATDKDFYAEYHFGMWGVFGTESGFCYATYMDEQEAKDRADLKTHAAKGWSIDARPKEKIDGS